MNPIPNVSKILIFRTDGIGDMLNSTPAISALRNAYPEAYISVVARPLGAEVLIRNPHVDEILVYDPANFTEKIKFIRRLRVGNYDMAVVLRNSSECNLMAYLSGARYRIGRWSERKCFSFTLTHGVTTYDPKGTKHEVDRNLDVVRLVGAENGERDLVLCLSDEERAYAREFLKKQRIQSKNSRFHLVGIHPGGSSFDKLWLTGNFAEIANRLAREFNSSVMLFNGPGEENLAQEIQAQMEIPPIRAGKISLRKMSALIGRCSLFICNDSGPMHIAAALKVPTVAIFGSTDHVRWRPYSDNAVVVRRDMDCFPCSAHKCKRGYECTKTLPVDDVWKAITEKL